MLLSCKMLTSCFVTLVLIKLDVKYYKQILKKKTEEYMDTCNLILSFVFQHELLRVAIHFKTRVEWLLIIDLRFRYDRKYVSVPL